MKASHDGERQNYEDRVATVGIGCTLCHDFGRRRSCTNSTLLRNQEKGVLAKGVFAEIRRFLSHRCVCIICTATWHPMCPLATSPCFSALLLCLSSICCFKGSHVSWRQARYRTTCKIAERKYSTAFDKSEKPFVQEQGVSVQTAICIPKSKLLCDLFPPISANFRDFPRLSANFRDFPPLSGATFRRQFPPVSATFRTLRWRSRKKSGNFRTISANSRSAVCTAWAWSRCAVELAVHS